MINQITIGLKKHNRLSSLFLALFGIILLVSLGVYNQPNYPPIWLDEGFVIQGAMNLVRYGEYAMKSVEGFRILDQPLIANGPGVVLPIAATFKLFGVGILQARLVVAAFMTLSVLLYFFLGKRLFGSNVAFISILLLLAIPKEGFIIHGRMAMGNVPALAYLLIGYLFWLRDIENQKLINLTFSGFFFGISIITKTQNMILVGVFILTAILDFYYYKIYSL